MKPYTITAAPVVAKPLQGMDAWIKRAVFHSDKSLWNNGSWVVRDVRGKPGIVSNHAKGVAVDLSYRWISATNKGRQDGRKISLAFINKCLENAETLGIELVIDYAMKRTWRCDRATWKAFTCEQGDWFHIEINPVIANSPELAQQAWNRVFGLIPQVTIKPV
jgi:hypothetical protein